jgi:hypothetical protein
MCPAFDLQKMRPLPVNLTVNCRLLADACELMHIYVRTERTSIMQEMTFATMHNLVAQDLFTLDYWTVNIWKQSAVAYFKIQSRHLAAATKGRHGALKQPVGIRITYPE